MRLLIIIVTLLLTLNAADAIECQSSASSGGRGHWAWRMVDGKKCWYAGKPGMDKSKLSWPAKTDKAASLDIASRDIASGEPKDIAPEEPGVSREPEQSIWRQPEELTSREPEPSTSRESNPPAWSTFGISPRPLHESMIWPPRLQTAHRDGSTPATRAEADLALATTIEADAAPDYAVLGWTSVSILLLVLLSAPILLIWYRGRDRLPQTISMRLPVAELPVPQSQNPAPIRSRRAPLEPFKLPPPLDVHTSPRVSRLAGRTARSGRA